MIGIIYKFTILARYKMDGHKPFYIGQHWCKSIDKFISGNSDYYGSGTIWKHFLKRISNDYPKHWKKFIKREILYASKSIKQSGLDALEEHYIKKYKSHYSYKLGGCNVLPGTANKFGSLNPAKDLYVKKKMSIKQKVRMRKPENNPMYGKKLSNEAKKKISERVSGIRNYWYGKRGSELPFYRERLTEEHKNKIRLARIGHEVSNETRKKISIANKGKIGYNKGKKLSEQTRKKISMNHADVSGKNNPMYGSTFIWITNGVDNKRCCDGIIPNGWREGITFKN